MALDVNGIVKMVPGLKLNSTINRHRIPTIYTSFDMSTADAKIFFQHESHTEYISRENYRCPPALKETLVMGRLLMDVDEGRLYKCFSILKKYFHV